MALNFFSGAFFGGGFFGGTGTTAGGGGTGVGGTTAGIDGAGWERICSLDKWLSEYEVPDEKGPVIAELSDSMRRLYRIAPCECGGEAQWGLCDEGWEIRCPDCDSSSATDEKPASALMSWNAQVSGAQRRRRR
jgi:hypothetical protein